MHENIFPDAIKAVVNGGELSGLLLIFSSLEYLSGYFAGKSSQAKDFVAFMARYFPEQYIPYLEDIYSHLRNGLVHNLSITNPWISSTNSFTLEKESNFHLQLVSGKPVFSARHFIEDTHRAAIMYSYDLIMKPDDNLDLVANLQKRFNKHDGAASMMVKI